MLSRSVLQRSRAIVQRRLLSTWVATSPAASGMTLSAADAQLKPSQAREFFRSMAMEDDDQHDQLAYGLSFAHGDQVHDDEAWKFSVLTDARMQAQLEHSRQQQQQQEMPQSHSTSSTIPQHHHQPQQDVVSDTIHYDTAPLPRTLEDALRPSRRAIVVTETTAPFRVVDVNRAWSDLCGYSFVESKDKSLGDLLRGPETDQLAATALVSKLLQGEEAGAVLTNYTKDGRRFRNRVRVGPLFTGDHVSHFVGVLQEI